jgi:hypothetical protein
MPFNCKKGQQEMVGFVIIVVLVVIGLFVFLIFSLRPGELSQSDIANNVLSSIMKTTSDCALVYEPNYDDMRDLFRSCHEGRECANTLVSACDTLERDLESILDEMLILSPYVDAYQLDFSHEDDVGVSQVFRILKGGCNGTVYGSEPHSIRLNADEHLLVQLRICLGTDVT